MIDKPRARDEALLDVPPCRPMRSLAIISGLAVLSAICAALLSWIAS